MIWKYHEGERHAYLGGAGDISPMTAFGVIRAMQCCCNRVYGSDSLEGKRVAIQGLGMVGHHVVGQLHEIGAKMAVTDMEPEKVDAIFLQPTSKLQTVFIYTDTHLLLDHLVAGVGEWKINQGRIRNFEANGGEIWQYILFVECSAGQDNFHTLYSLTLR